MSPLFKALQQLEQDLLRRPATLQEVLPGAQPRQTSVDPAKDVWPKFYIPCREIITYGNRVAYYRRDGEKIGRTFCEDGTSFIFSEWDDHGEIEVSEEVAKSRVNWVPETPQCLTEKQFFVMSYLAVRAHSIEGFIDGKVMAAIHTDAEKIWDMLQKGLKKG